MVIDGQFIELGVGEEMILQQGAGEGRVWQTGCYGDEGDQRGGEMGDDVGVGEIRAPAAGRHGSHLRCHWGTGPEPSAGGRPSTGCVLSCWLSLSLLALVLGGFADTVPATAAAAVWSGLEGRPER